MTCPSCAHENRAGAKFCEECAAPLPRACASCGAELRPTAKFCDECAAPTGASPRTAPPPRATAAAPADIRKVVTIVFADLVGSTALHERLDPESARRFMESYYAAMRGAVEAQGGTVTQLLGDGVKAVFGIPRVAEDDAIRAVRAAVAMQDAFRALAEAQRGAVGKTGLRVAVNTGEVVANDATEIIGDPVNVAARLQEQGKDGDVVVGESTYRLVSTLVTLELLGSFALKGRSEAVKAYRVVSLERPAGAAAAPFVGRDEEIARLDAVYETAVEKPAAALAVLLGSPGLGKSRLIEEFGRRRADAATVVEAHCDAAGGATFAPLADGLRKLLAIETGATADSLRASVEEALPADDADRARIAGGVASLLAGSPASPEETFFVVRRFLAALARRRPLVLVIDDLQWGEPLLLDLVEHLVQWGTGVPLFVLIGARPELRELRSSLVTPGGFVSDVIPLGGLDAGAAMRLAANVVGAADLPAAVAAKVLATSEGNPLFVGELVRMLVQEGALTRDGDRWTVGANLAALEMPPTIHALLAARIERLRPEERLVLERAAVVGRHFSRSAVAALLPREAGELDARLEALRRSALIERDTGWLLGEPVLRFHHVLIRDAAYRRLLKGTRAELHAQLADWIEAQVGDAAEHDETIGWHLEQAHQLLRELGPLDENGRGLGARAATRLAAAGRRALARDDVPVAADLLGRAIERLDADDPARADLALDWCEALLAAGDVGPAAAAIEELGRLAADSDRLRAWHVCFAGQHQVLTAPSELNATADAVASAAAALTAQDDAAGEAKAHYVHALALARLGKVGACEAALDRALAAARRAGDRRRANTVLAIAPLAALWGPSPVTRASGRCLDVVRVLRITQGAPAVESVALSCQGVLEALRGRTEAARRMIASARKMVEELGITQRLLEADVFGGLVSLLEGDAPAAERALRGAYAGLRDLGLGIDAARAAALLARALLAQGRAEEAEALSHESEALAGDDLKAAIAWRGVRAEALARRGESAAAVALASRAVEIAAATDALLDHADARIALAVALRAAGRAREADAEERRARELWETKGATLLAERAAPAEVPVAPPLAAAAPPTARTARRRRVRPNFAFEEMRRAEAAVAARDARALETLYRRDIEIVDHQFGITYGYAEIVERVRLIIEDSAESAFAHEPLASLGESLALCRMLSTASGSTALGIPVGETEVPYLLLIEADEQGSARRIDIFGEDKLDDAVTLLYERHAALLPDGPERARAAATARSFAVIRAANADPERLRPALAPDVEGIDHRNLRTWSLRGAEAYLAHLRALHQVAGDVAFTQGELLALAPNAKLTRTIHRGTDRTGGGAYERAFLSLWVAGADGRIARVEWFDDDREAEALARFEELAEVFAPPATPRRRVRLNDACAISARLEAALAARDFDAVRALIPEAYHEIDHSTGSEWGRDAAIASLERLFRSRDPHYELEMLATLGDGLVLTRRRTGSSGDTRGRYDVGPYEHEALQLAECDARGLVDRQETFAAERLGDALARLYERHAERSPEGAAREQAAATARTVGALLGAPDLDAWRACLAAGIEFADHRILGFGSLRGREAGLPYLKSLFETSESLWTRIDDVLALEPHAFLVRWTESGVAVGGGDFERVQLTLWSLDGEGRVARLEYFDVDRDADALARFEALTGATAPPERRRVRANAATEAFERGRVAIDARDADALAELFDEALTVVHHPTRASYGRRGMLTTWRSTMRAERLEFRQELLASLGETLALDRHVVTVDGLAEEHLAGFGATVFDQVWLLEVDEHGHWIRLEIFAPDRLGDAVVRLYERHAAQQPEGSARTRAAAVAHAALAMMGPIDLDRMAAAFAPEFRLTDHRVLATWSAETGAELVEHFRRHLELAPDFAPRIDDVLALDPRALVARITFVGTARDSGGAFENRCCVVYQFGDDGCIAEIDCFEAEQESEAIARFEALFDGAPGETAHDPFENAAARADRLLFESFNARDWPGIDALAAPDLVFDERRRMVRNSCGRDVWLEQFRVLFDVPASRFTTELRATRGERLALSLHRFAGEVAGGGGPLAMDDHLVLHEVDRDGRIVAIVLFDLDDEDAAYAELHARFDADPSAAHARTTAAFDRAIARRDWGAVTALCSPAFVEHDHRSLAVLGTTRGAEAWMQNFRALVDLAPDTIYRTLHARGAARGFLSVGAWLGSREGGRYEIPLLAVCEVDAQGAITRADLYEPSQHDRALARFRELDAAPPVERFANAAFRANEALVNAVHALDWEAALALAPSLMLEDRRRLVRTTASLADHLRFLFEIPGFWVRTRLLATRGERIALHETTFGGRVAGGGGELESEVHLDLVEVDAGGRVVANLLFSPEDLAAAYAELDARYAAGEGAAHPNVLASWLAMHTAGRKRDWDALAQLHAPAFALRDHRPLGWGTLVRDAATMVRMIRSARELAPDAEYRTHHLRVCARGTLARMVLGGTRDGGSFETPFLRVTEMNEQGLMLSADLYDENEVERALARFAEIAAAAPAAESAEPFANAASAILQPLIAAVVANDWARYEALFTETVRCSDRRRMVQLDFDRDAQLAFARELAEGRRARGESATLATRGERLALVRSTFVFEDADVGPSEVDSLLVLEVDASGRISAFVRFDPEDLDAAWAELEARWQAGEGAAQAPALAFLASFEPALARRDWNAVVAGYAPAFVGVDHRLVGWGTLQGPAAFVEAFRTLVALAPDVRLRWEHLRASSRGLLAQAIWLGTRDGGAFENPFLMVGEFGADGRILRADFYDVHHVDRALARFRELDAASPVERFANAASRANRALGEASNARDLARIEALLAPSLVFDDRRRLNRLKVGREEALTHYRFLQEVPRGRFSSTLLATRGERLALHRTRFDGEVAGGGGAVAVEEVLDLAEIDAEGRVVANLLFDLEDEDAAYAELDARFEAGEGAHVRGWQALRGVHDPIARRDWEAAAAALAPGHHIDDHRKLGWGRELDSGALFVQSQRSLAELAPDFQYRFDHVRVSDRGYLAHLAQVGTREGGPFESPFVYVAALDAGGLPDRFDLWDPEDAAQALARFAEIESAAPPRPSPFANAASRAADEIRAHCVAADWDAYAESFPAHFRLSDRRRNVQLELGRDEMIAFSRSLAEHATRAVIDTETLATRGERLALQRWRIEIAGDDAGPSEISHLDLLELDERGLRKALVRWDDDAIDAAYDELDARFEAGEGAAHPDALAAYVASGSALRSRDWDALTAVHAPTFRMRDHRLLGWGTMANDTATFVRVIQSAVELAPDARYRDDHLRICARGTLVGSALCGTREGGYFESPFVRVTEHDAQSRILSHDLYDVSDFERALARFEEIRASGSRDPHAPTPNAASAAMDRWAAAYDVAFDTGDWEPMRAVCAPGHVFDDRRRLALLSGDRELMIASARQRVAMGARPQRTLLGTAGDRVAVETILWSGGPADGPFEIEYVGVIEVDAAGLISAFVLFDADDAHAARREAWARWAAIEPEVAPHLAVIAAAQDAFNAQDRDGTRATLADELVVEDHRRTGFGTLRGADAYADSIAVLWELAERTEIELGRHWLAFGPHGALTTVRRTGDVADGGAFESDYLYLFLHERGRVTRVEMYESESADAALARFEALRPEALHADPLRIPPNAAVRAMERLDAYTQAGDWDAIRALCAPVALEDRRRGLRATGGCEAMVESARFLHDNGLRAIRTLLATAGDRWELHHSLWRDDAERPTAEAEMLELLGIDAEGRIDAVILFDPGDRAAAHDELFERGAERGIDGTTPPAARAFVRAVNAHDRAAARAALTDDFVFHDRRRTGTGRLDGADAYLPALDAIFGLSPDVRIDTLCDVSIAPHGRVGVGRTWGTNAEGGAFESVYFSLIHYRGERVAGIELFELEDRDAALARLAQLGREAGAHREP